MEEAQNRQNDIGEVYAGQKTKGKRLSAKSIVLIVLSVVFLAAAVLVPVLLLTSKNKIAYKEETVGDWVRQYNASTKTYDIVRYIGEPRTININGVTYENAVLIPLELEGISVGLIRAHAFDANENDTLLQVENIVFEKGTRISKIEKYAFDSCKNLKQIQIPASVKNVGSYAFNNCINLEKITIENAYGFTFSENALKGTDKLKTLEILSVTDNFDQSNTLGNIGSLNSNNNDLNLELGQGVNGIGSGFIASGVKELTVFNYKNLAIDSSTLYSVETLNIKYFGEGDETDTLTESFMEKFKSASNLKNINILDKEINKIGLYALTSFSGIEKLIVSSGTSFDINFTNTSDGTSHNANLAIYFKEDSDCSVTFYTTLLTNSTLGQNLINKFASDEKNKISTIIIEDSISQISCGINSEDGFKLVKNIKFDGNFSNVGNTFFSTQASNPFVVDNGIGLNIEGPESYNNAIFKNFNAPKGVFYKRASYNGKEEFGAVVINLVKVDKNGIRISNSTDRFIEVPVGVNIADYIIRTDADSVDNRYENPSIAIKLIVNSELTFLPIDGVKFALATEEKISGTYDVDTKTMYVSNTFDVDGKVVEDNSTYQVYMVYEAQKTPVYFESYYNNIGSDGYGLYGESVSQPLATGETEKINIDKPGVVFDIETTKANNESIADLISYEDGKLVIIVDTSKIHNRDTIKLYYTRETYKVTISQNPDNDTVNEPSVPSVTEYEVTYGQNFTWLTEISVSRDGYTLVGWKYDDIVVNAGNYATVEYNTTAPTTVYAQWVAVNQNFTIKHWFENANNDSFTEDEDNRVTAQALAGTIVSDIAVDKLSVTGFAFSKIENTHDFIEGNGNTVVNIYYVRNRLNITITPEAKGSSIIYYNGEVLYNGSVATSKILTLKYEQTIALEDLTREGYDFVGYLYNGNDFTLTEMPNNSIYLTDKWIPKTATITLDTDGGTTAGNVTEITLTFDAKYPLLPTSTKKGYTFKGWYKVNGDNSTSDTKIEFNTSETVTNLENYTIRATWEAYTFTGEYYVDGASEATHTQTWTYDAETAVINVDDVTKDGHTFDGWLLVGGSTYNKGDSVKALFTDAENGKVFRFDAEFTPYTLTVKYYVNSSLVEEKVWKFTDDAKVEIDNPTQKGWTFIGWNGEYTKGESINELFNGKENGAVINLSATFEKNSYFVEFNVNGGSFEGEDPSKEYEFDSTITLPNATKKGNTLKWSDGTTEYSAGDKYRLTKDENIIFTAKWTPISSTVKFNSKGGNPVADIEVTYGQTYGQNIPEPTREGYDFDGWYANESYTGSKITFTSATTVELITDVTYYAKWNAKQYTITFDAKGGNVTPEELKVQYDSTYSISIPEPTWAGHSFDGWFTDEDCTAGNEVSFTAGAKVELIADVTYYAKWTANTYTATFKSQYPGAEEVEIQVTYGKPYGTLPPLEYEGYTTDGWYVGETKITAETNVTTAGDHDVIGKVTINQYKVTLVLNGGTLVDETIEGIYDYGTELTLPRAEKKGNTLKWNDGTAEYDAGYTFNLGAADVTFTADWTPVKVTVKFDDDFGGTIADKEYTYDENYTGLPTPNEQSGYTFEGWYDESGNKIESNTQIKNDGTHTLTAKWSKNVIAVTLDPNGGTVNPTIIYVQFANKYVIYNDTAIESEDFESLTSNALPTPTRTGYTFKGWYVGETEITAETNVTTATPHSLIAEWEGNPFKVTYHSNVPGNDETHDEEYIYGTTEKLWTSYFTYVVDQKVWTLIGWTTNADGTGTYYSKDENVAFSVSDYDLYAKWSAEFIEFTLKITYDIIDNTGYGVETTTTTQTIIISQDGLAKDGDNFIVPSSAFTINSPYDFDEAYYTKNIQEQEPYTLPQSGGTVEVKYTRNIQTVTLLDPDGEDSGYFIELPYGANITKALESGDYADFYEVFCLYMADDAVEGHYNNGFTVKNEITEKEKELTSESIVDGPVTMKPIYIANSYTILFDKNDARAEQVTGKSTSISFTYNADGTITLPVDLFTLYGNNLTAWKYTASDSNVISVDTEYKVNIKEFLENASTDDNNYLLGKVSGYTITIYANWEPKEVQVTLNANGGKVNEKDTDTITVTFGQAYGELPEPTWEGREFDAWYDNNGNVITKDSIVNKENHTLTAEWIAKEIKITLNANGGTVTPTTIILTYGQKYVALPTPTWAGHTFKGWYRNAEGTGDKVEFDTNATVNSTEEFTLYAKWEVYTFTAEYYVDGKLERTDTWEYDEAATVLIEDPTKTGHTFVNWKESATSGTYVRGDAITGLFEGKADKHTFRFDAAFTPRTYTVTFDPNGGEIDGTDPSGRLPYGTVIDIPNATKKGNTFNGWKLNDATTAEYDAESKYTLGAADVTFTADWTPITIDIILNPNGGTVTPTTITLTYGQKYKALPTPTWEGHTFKGWYRNAEGTGDKVEFDTNATVNSTEKFTLYAKWEANTVDITLDANGGTVTPTTIILTYGQKYVALPTPTWAGHTFKGWYRNAEGTGDKVEFDTNATVNSTEEFTLYAKWQIKTFTVTLDPNGGTVDPTIVGVTYGKPYGELPTPTWEGHKFNYWTLDGVAVDANTNVTSTGDHKLKADWTPYSFEIQYYIDGKKQQSDYVSYEDTVTISVPDPEWTGYTFDGWNGMYYFGNDIHELLDDKEDGAVIRLDAVKTPIQVIVTLDPNGGTVDPTIIYVQFANKYGIYSDTAIESEDFELLTSKDLPTPTCPGHDFGGWKLNDEIIDASYKVQIATPHTLVAVWTPAVYKVSLTIYRIYDNSLSKFVNGGNTTLDIYVLYGSTFGKYIIANSRPTADAFKNEASKELPAIDCDYRERIEGYYINELSLQSNTEVKITQDVSGFVQMLPKPFEVKFYTMLQPMGVDEITNPTQTYGLVNCSGGMLPTDNKDGSYSSLYVYGFSSGMLTFTAVDGYYIRGIYRDAEYSANAYEELWDIDNTNTKATKDLIMHNGYSTEYYIVLEKASVLVTLTADAPIVNGFDNADGWTINDNVASKRFDALTYTEIVQGNLATPRVPGYKFDGWRKDGVTFTSYTVPRAARETLELSVTPGDGLIELLSAEIKFKALDGNSVRQDDFNNFNVANGYTFEITNVNGCSIDGTIVSGITLSRFTFTASLDGYEYVGLYIDDVRVDNNNSYVITEDVILEARFVAKRIIVNIEKYVLQDGTYVFSELGGQVSVFDAMGGVINPINPANPTVFEVFHGETLTIEGSANAGFSVDAIYKDYIGNGATSVDDSKVIAGGVFTPEYNESAAVQDKSIKLSIVFETKLYTIKATGEESWEEDGVTFTPNYPTFLTNAVVGNSFTITNPTGTSGSKKVFLGYEYGGHLYVSGDTFKLTSEIIEMNGDNAIIELRAVWSFASIIVTVEKSDGTTTVTNYANNSDLQTAINALVAENNAGATITIDLFGEFVNSEFNNVYNLSDAIFGNNLTDGKLIIRSVGIASIVIKKGLGNMFTGSNYSIEIGEGIVLDGNASSGSLIAISATKSTSAKVEIYGMIQNAMTGAVKLTQYNADINGMFVNNQGTIFEFVHGETNNTNSTLSGWFANNNAGESALISGAGDFTNAFVALDSLMFANNIGKIATIGSLNKMQYYDIGEIAIENHTADSDDALFFVEYEEGRSVNAVRFNGLNIILSNIGTLISASIVDFNEYIFISDSNTFTYSFDSDVTSNMLYVDASSIHFNVSDASYVSNLANMKLSNDDLFGTQLDTNNPYFGKLYLIGDTTIPNTGEYTFECNNLIVDTLIGPSEIREYGKEIYILGNGVVADNVYGQFRITGNAKVYNVYGEVTFDSLFNVNQSPYINIHSDKMNEVAFHYGNIDIANALMPKLTLISSDAEAFIANVRSHAWIAKGPFAVLSTKEQDPLSGQAGYTWVNGKLTWTPGYSEPVGTFFDLTGVDMSVSGWETDVGLPSGYNSTTIVITEDTNLNHSGISGLSVVAAGYNDAITLNGANHCRVGETGGKIIVESVNTDTNISVGLGYNAQIRSSLMGVGDSGFIDYNGGSLYYGFDESTALKENPLFSLQNKMFVEDIDTYSDLFNAFGGIVNANTLTRPYDLRGNAIVTGNADLLGYISGNATILGTLGVSGNNKVEIEGTYWYGSIGEIVYDGEYNEETIILSLNYLEQDNINAKVRVNGELVTLAKLAAPVDGYYGFIANDKNYAVQVGDQVFESINDEAVAAALASSDKTIHLIRDITASDITADINNINIIIDGHNSATIDMAGASQFEKATIKDVTITGGLAGTFVIDGEVNYTGNTAQITADITVNGTLNVFDNTFDGYIFAPSALAGNGTINIYQNNASGALISDGAVAKLNVYDNSGAGVMITGAVTELDNVMISKNGGDGLVIDALGATYIEITNITITGNNGHGVVVNNPANRTAHVSMSNYAITNNAGNGIEFTTDTRVSQQFVLADGMILSNGEYGINLYDGYELTIAGAIVYGSGSVGLNINSGVAILDMGTITGFETGVYIKSNARFDMNYGTIANCSEYGVYVDANANFNMTGGEIANISSSATTYSLTTPVAVKVLGNAIIDQGSISNSAIGIDLDAFGNLDLADGALINNCTTGLSVNSDFTFTGGTIYNCEMGIVSNNKVIIAGGAIAETGIAFCGQGALKVEGGYIYSCDVVADTTYGSGSGGAEYAFEMTGGEIDNCSTIMETATYAKVSGGRITNVHIAFTINSILIEGDAYISGTGEKDSTLGWRRLTMNGGTIENFDIAVKDISYDQGHGLVNTVTINDGVIRNCGIAAQGLNITMNGGRIENCEKGLEGVNINFGGDAVITHDLAENGAIISETYGIYINREKATSDRTVTIIGGVIENLAIAIDNDFNNSEVNFSNGLIQNCERAIVAGTGLMSGGKIYNCNDGVIFNNLTGRVTGGEIVNEIGGNLALSSYSTDTTSFEFSNVTISGYETAVSSMFVVMKSGTIKNCSTALSGTDVTFEDGLINNCGTGVECSYTTMTGGTIKNTSLAINTSTIRLSGGTITNDLVNGKVKTGTIGVKPLTMGNAADESYVFITGGAISNCEVGIMSNVFMNNGDEITGVKISNCTYGISWNQSNPYKVNLGAGVEITDCGTGVFMNQVNIVGGVKIAGCDVGIHTNGYTMAGGEITNCTKGVYVGGDGTITAGTLTNCEIAIEGSVSFGGTATITNDLVNGKVKAGTTGIKAIANSNTVSMTGGEISNCEYGVDVAFSGLSMSNGEIKNCTYGAANSEDFTYGISISNLAKITNCGYGIKSFGIYEINNGEAPAEVTISGGTISGCSTAVFGDRVEIIGAAIITDGNIGIISQYELSMTAGTISGFDDKAIYCFGSAFITGGYISNCAYGIVKDAYGFGEGNIIIGAVQVSDCEVGACFVGMHGTNVNITGTFKNCNIGVIIEEVNSGTIQLTGAVIQDFDSCGISIISSTAEITMSSCIITTNVESTIAVGYTGSQESLTINSSVLTATTGISLDSGKITINDISIENCEKGIEATATGTIVAKGGEISGCDYGIYAPEGSVEDFAMTITTITDDGVVGVQAGTIVSTGGEISNMTTGIIVEGNSGSQIENTTITNCEVGIKADNSVTIINPYIEITDSSLKAEGTIGVDAVNPVINKGMICGYDIGVNISGTGSIDASIRGNNIGVYVTSEQVGTEINISGNIGNNTTGIILDENFVGTVNFGSQSGAADMIDANYDGGVKVYGGTFKLLSGDIVTNSLTGSEKFGAGIYVAGANANLEINGGSVSLQNQDSGKARFGGGVYFAGNTFTMNGGAIRDNAATEAGGGVYIAAGQMIINGGSIEANTVVNTDKDVYGAGIYVANYTLPTGVSSALNISGGSISGNSITSENGDEYGAGLYIDNVAVMSAGIVKDHNAVDGKAKYGGGAYITENGSLTMNGGAFLNNYATVNGGGIYDNGTFVMIGGTVSYNGTTTNDTTIESKEYFTIVFDGAGADSGSIAAVMVVKVTGEITGTTKLPVNKFVKEGFTFGGWEYTDANGNTASIAPGSDLVYVETMASNGVITLTAIWNEITE